jgi:FkbM family methyltransferase
MLKKIFNYFGYTFSKSKKSTNIYEIIKLRLDSCPTDILLDVGANHGDFSKNLINYFKQLHLFEPNDELSKFLYKNFKQNKVKILNFGLGDTNEKILLNLTNDTGKTLSSIKSQTNELKDNLKNTKITKKLEIQIKRLDQYLETLNIIDEKIFLKIDTQGNDFETLIGLGKYISNINFLKIEMPCIKLYKTNYDHWDIFAYLKQYKFEPVFFEHNYRKKNGQLIEYDCFFEKKVFN